MKNNYEKYIEEVWKMKDKVYSDFKKVAVQNISNILKMNLRGINFSIQRKLPRRELFLL
jgi:hypothetical protein